MPYPYQLHLHYTQRFEYKKKKVLFDKWKLLNTEKAKKKIEKPDLKKPKTQADKKAEKVQNG